MTNIQEISQSELYEVGGGDWFETTWGVLLGAGFAAGSLGSGGFLIVGSFAGAGLIFGPMF